MSEAPYEPSAAERELLLVLAEEQERWERGEWDSRTTLWSRVSYRMGKARDKLTPTHIPGKFNLDRVFEVTFRRLVHRLFKQGLVRLRPIGDQAEERPRQTLGYRAHEARTRDLFLTDAGRALAAALPGRPRRRRARSPTARSGGRRRLARSPTGTWGRQAPPVSAPRQEVAEVVVARPEGATRPRVARAERPTRVRRRS